MGTHRFLKFGANNMAWTLGGRTTGENHDASTGILEGGLKQANRNAKSNTRTSQRSLVVRNGPRITLKLLKNVGNLELGLLDRKKESCSGAKRRTSRLLRHVRTHSRREETKHLLDLLSGVFFAASEHVRFGAFGVA